MKAEGEAATDGAEAPPEGQTTEGVEGGEGQTEQTDEQKPEGEPGQPAEESKSPVPQVKFTVI